MLHVLKALPPQWRFGAVVALLVLLIGGAGGLYTFIRHQGFVEGEAAATARCTAERQAQEKANREAISKAEKRLFELADRLSLTQMELDDAIADVDAGTAADPLGADLCLDAGGVRRLQTIR